MGKTACPATAHALAPPAACWRTSLTRDNEHPFFRPLWRRIAAVCACLAWSVLEFVSKAPTWGFIALAFAAYAIWQFFINYRPPPEDGGRPDRPTE